jgi:hypothetical protein
MARGIKAYLHETMSIDATHTNSQTLGDHAPLAASDSAKNKPHDDECPEDILRPIAATHALTQCWSHVSCRRRRLSGNHLEPDKCRTTQQGIYPYYIPNLWESAIHKTLLLWSIAVWCGRFMSAFLSKSRLALSIKQSAKKSPRIITRAVVMKRISFVVQIRYIIVNEIWALH